MSTQLQRASVITLFPEMFDAWQKLGVVGSAVQRGLVAIDYHNPKEYALGKHRKVDDKSFGGGPGMLMKYAPIARVIEALSDANTPGKVIYFSPGGVPITPDLLQNMLQVPHLILLCGRYEGVDQRAIDKYVDLEISLGHFVLSGGEIAALALLDSLLRFVPEVLGNDKSAQEDSFSAGLLKYPQYTTPACIDGMSVPPVLLSGNHKAIAAWRKEQSILRTQKQQNAYQHTANLVPNSL